MLVQRLSMRHVEFLGLLLAKTLPQIKQEKNDFSCFCFLKAFKGESKFLAHSVEKPGKNCMCEQPATIALCLPLIG